MKYIFLCITKKNYYNIGEIYWTVTLWGVSRSNLASWSLYDLRGSFCPHPLVVFPQTVIAPSLIYYCVNLATVIHHVSNIEADSQSLKKLFFHLFSFFFTQKMKKMLKKKKLNFDQLLGVHILGVSFIVSFLTCPTWNWSVHSTTNQQSFSLQHFCCFHFSARRICCLNYAA